MEGRVNVKDVFENPESYYGRTLVPKKINPFNTTQRLNTITDMMEMLERTVANAEVSLGQHWVDAYDNLYNALQICKDIEKSNI